jgi:hypothetical protein
MSQKRARASRSDSTAPRTRRPQQVVRAMGPADLLRFVPELLPVDPEDSLVLILFRHTHGTRSRTQGAMRVDLRHSEDAEELEAWASAVLGRILDVDGVTGVAIAAYTPETFAPSGRPPAAAQVRAVARQAERMGLEVLDRFCVGADGWGSLGDPDLPRGGRPLALLEPAEARAPRHDPLAEAAAAPEEQRDRFAEHYGAWWDEPEGPGGVLHGVDLGRVRPGEEQAAMDRYRWGRDVDAVVALVEGVLQPHADADRPCACRGLLLALVVRQGLIGLLLAQIAWGPAFGKEVWTAVSAPDGRRRSIDRMLDAIAGGRFRRPDTDRIDAGVAALAEVASYVDLPRTGAGIDEALAWLHWARGASSTAARLAERALQQDTDRDIAPILLAKAQRGVLPEWAFRKDPRKPDRFDVLLTTPLPSGAPGRTA